MPRVSVIIPTYNREHIVLNAIQSVIDQTFKDFEIIVVDDGSKDRAEETVKNKYGDKIHYFYQMNKGVPAARNQGIKIARGEYIAFLDDDDIWLPEKLRHQVTLLDSYLNVGLVYTNYYKVQSGKKSANTYFDIFRPYRGRVLRELYKKNNICPSSVVLRKKCIDKVGLFDESLSQAEDYDLWLRLAVHYDFDFIEKPLVLYDASLGGGRVSSNVINNLKWTRVCLEKMKKSYPEILKENEVEIQKRFASLAYLLSRYLMIDERYGEAIKELINSIRLNPFYIKAYVFLIMSIIKVNITKK